MRKRSFVFAVAALSIVAAVSAVAQTTNTAAWATDHPAAAELAKLPWEWGPFFAGGKGVGDRADFNFTNAGVRLGKVITNQHLGGIFRGQFEYAGELIPYWQAFTPSPHLQPYKCYDAAAGLNFTCEQSVGGGTYTGVSLTPIILRWDFKPRRRIAPWFQAAGGLIYTTHKFPPDVLVAHGQPGGTSVWNFSPQGGIGVQYFVKPQQSLMLSVNAIHISSASLGDKNPGVNASVQFQLGYTWWSRKP